MPHSNFELLWYMTIICFQICYVLTSVYSYCAFDNNLSYNKLMFWLFYVVIIWYTWLNYHTAAVFHLLILANINSILTITHDSLWWLFEQLGIISIIDMYYTSWLLLLLLFWWFHCNIKCINHGCALLFFWVSLSIVFHPSMVYYMINSFRRLTMLMFFFNPS